MLCRHVLRHVLSPASKLNLMFLFVLSLLLLENNLKLREKIEKWYKEHCTQVFQWQKNAFSPRNQDKAEEDVIET